MRPSAPNTSCAAAVVAALVAAVLAAPVLAKSAGEEAASKVKDYLPDVTIRLVAAPAWDSRQSSSGESFGTFEMEGGIGTLATIGTGDKQSWHGELEGGIRGTIGSGDRTLIGSVTTLSLMANGYYGFKISDKVNGYAGAGIGIASHREDRGSDLGFGYQAMAGIGYKLTKKLTAIIGVRYFTTQAASIGRIRFEYGRPEAEVGVGLEF